LLLLADPVLPHSRGEIVLESKDPDAKPVIRMNYYDDPHDIRVMVAAIRRTMDIRATQARPADGAAVPRGKA
jgi:choline dehydrogenase